MRAMLLMWSDGSYSGGGAESDLAAWAEYEETIRADGALLEAGQFTDPSEARMVVTSISRHPETDPLPSQDLVGYYLLEVAEVEVAADYARRAPLYGTVEVRPLPEW